MNITNKHNLPFVVVDALTFDSYSRGESDISITQIIDSPRVSLLQREHADEIEQDAVDFIWSRFGTSVHEMFERSTQGGDCLSEERLFVDVNGWKLSGAIDLQQETPDGIIVSDYKVTSAWSVMYDKKEWHKQLNCYAWLVRHSKQMNVQELRIIAILRDWNRRKSEEQGNYPVSPVEIVKIPLWTDKEQDDYVAERVRLHQEADFEWSSGGDLPLCSPDERWNKEDTFAVIKKGSSGWNKRALRVLQSKEDAEIYQSRCDYTTKIESRLGESTRCLQNWCRVSKWCNQFQDGVKDARD